jgi:hypothetical protein
MQPTGGTTLLQDVSKIYDRATDGLNSLNQVTDSSETSSSAYSHDKSVLTDAQNVTSPANPASPPPNAASWLYRGAFQLDKVLFPQLQAAEVAPPPLSDPPSLNVYTVFSQPVPNRKLNGEMYTILFTARDLSVQVPPDWTPSQSGGSGAGGDTQPNSASNTELLSFEDAPAPNATPPDQKKTDTQGQGSDLVRVTAALVDCPSLLTRTEGAGFSWLPINSYQVGSTVRDGKTIYEVQTNQQQAGRWQAFVLEHYQLFRVGPAAFDVAAGVAAAKQAAPTYLFGVSMSFNDAIYLTGGLLGGTITSLNGYGVGEVVTKHTAITTTTSSAARWGINLSFPFGKGSSGKGQTNNNTTPGQRKKDHSGDGGSP